MKLHPDTELDKFGELFVARRYARYMTFDQFMEAPEHYTEQIERGACRPLLLSQRRVANAIDRALLARDYTRRASACSRH